MMQTFHKIEIIMICFIILILFFMLFKKSEHFQFEKQSELTTQLLQRLKEGNSRFINNQSVHPHSDMERVNETSTGQNPLIAILGCADSRVPAEIIFDQGVGDIFDVRNAGNLPTEESIGSLEYAVEFLGTKLIVVLGHTECGAIKSALKYKPDNIKDNHIESILDAIYPIAKKAKQLPESQQLSWAIKTMVNKTVSDLKQSKPILYQKVQKGDIDVVGAIYDIHTGQVHF